MNKLIIVVAFILVMSFLAVSQEVMAAGTAATTGGADVMTTHPLSTSSKNTAAPKTNKRTLNLAKPLVGSTLITYTYDNNGNLINKTEAVGP